MRRKYFLRGMGIGILVTVAAFAISLMFNPPRMSDEEVVAKAKQLGMVDESDAKSSTVSGSSTFDPDVIADVEESEKNTKDKAKATDEKAGEEKSKEEEAKEKEEAAKAKQEEAKNSQDEAKAKQDEAKQQQKNANSATGEKVSFSVRPGENSINVGENLYKLGLIDNVNRFNDYLEQNNYDNDLVDGDYSIRRGSTYEEIARLLTGK